MLGPIVAAVVAMGGALCAYLYFRPPVITPVSEETLAHLAEIAAKKGDSA